MVKNGSIQTINVSRGLRTGQILIKNPLRTATLQTARQTVLQTKKEAIQSKVQFCTENPTDVVDEVPYASPYVYIIIYVFRA